MILSLAASHLLSPDPPENLVASSAADGIYLEWTPSPTAGIESYRIERRAVEDTVSVLIARLPSPNLSYFDTTATGGIRYAYRVQAIDFLGVVGPFSVPTEAEFRDAIPPGPPDSLAIATSEFGLFLDWSEPADDDLAFFRVFRAPSAGPFLSIANPVNSQLLDAGAAVGQEYRYYVTAVDHSTNEGPASDTIRALRRDEVAPAGVSDLSSVGVAAGIYLSWVAPSDPDLERFRIYRDRSPDQATVLVELPKHRTAFLDSTAAERLFYIYRVSALDASGNEAIPAFTQNVRPDVTPPSTPDSFRVRRSENSILLEWAENAAVDLSHYELTILSLPDSSASTVRIDRSTLHYLDRPFGPGLPKAYTIAAFDSTGNMSPASEPIVTTLPPRRVSLDSLSLALLPGHSYQLVSVPGEPTWNWTSSFDGERGVDFELLHASSLDPLAQTATPIPGQAIWARSSSYWQPPEKELPVVDLGDSGYTYRIRLRPGWNVIANPFPQPIDWGTVLAHNGLTGGLWLYSYGFSPSTHLMPFSGYYYLNRGQAGSIEIPFSTVQGPLDAGPMFETELIVDTGLRRFHVSLGYDPAASPDIDPLDRILPESPFGDPQVSLLMDGVSYQRLVLPTAQVGAAEFALVLERVSGLTTIYAQDRLPEGVRTLVENSDGTVMELRDSGTVFSLSHSRTVLTLNHGSGLDPIQEPTEGLAAFPSPFSDHVIIQFRSTQTDAVRLDAYDLTGRRVANVFVGTVEEGLQRIAWAPDSRIAAGVYVIRLSSPVGTETIPVSRIR